MQTLFTLRPWKTSDVESLVRYANNPLIAKNMTDKFPHPYTHEKAIQFIAWATHDNPIHLLAIDIKGEAVGGIGVHPQDDIQRLNAELGYWLAEPFWGQGIMTAAVNQMIDFAFNTYPIHRLFACPFPTNIASQKILEKNQFILEARLPKKLIKNNQVMDELIYAIRREVWEKQVQERV